MWKRAICLSCVLLTWSIASGQYASDFEAVNASAAGEVLTGQDGYYLPPATTSVDFLAYTYAGNVLGIPQNPEGGDQFVAGEGPAGGAFARAQRDMNWGLGTTTWTVGYDVLTQHNGTAPGNNNLGSFSLQPFPGSASYIHLFRWVVGSTTNWETLIIGYNAAGVQFPAPYVAGEMGPAFTNLELDHWYRFTTDIDFLANQVVAASITDLTTGECASIELVDVYLEGGAGGGSPVTTGFRFFAGGGVPGNLVAWDNAEIREGVAEECGGACDPCDMDCIPPVNALDIEFFIDLLFNNADPCCGNRGEVGSTGDVNLDGSITAADIEGFIECLFGP